MSEFKVDLGAIKQAKDQKNNFFIKLKSIDFEGSGLISLDQFILLATKYDINLSNGDITLLREKYKKLANQNKIEYIIVMNDLKMKLDRSGNIQWVIGDKSINHAQYKINIQKLQPGSKEITKQQQYRSVTNDRQQDITKKNKSFNTQRQSIVPNNELEYDKQNNSFDLIVPSQNNDFEINNNLNNTMQLPRTKNDSLKLSDLPNLNDTTRLPEITKNLNKDMEQEKSIPLKYKQEIKKQFKALQLDIKVLFNLKWEFQRRDIYSLTFYSEKELKKFIENTCKLSIPDSFIILLYQCVIINSTINLQLLKQFIDVCQDSVLQDGNATIKSILYPENKTGEQAEQEEFRKCAKEIEQKLNERYFTLSKAFRSFDVYMNGSITEKKFVQSLIEINCNLSESQIKAVFKQLDKENKGYLTFEDFCSIVQKRQITIERNKELLSQIASQEYGNNEGKYEKILQSRNSSIRSKSVNRNLNSGHFRNYGKQNDVISLYDQVESQSPSTIFKRKLKIFSEENPNKQMFSTPQKIPLQDSQSRSFGKKIDRSESIEKIINYDYLNEALRQKLRDKFQNTISNNIGMMGPQSYKKQSRGGEQDQFIDDGQISYISYN